MFGSLFSFLENRKQQTSHRPRRSVQNRLVLESLEDRCLLSRYSITVIGTISSGLGDVYFPNSSINNAPIVQVAGRTNSLGGLTALSDHAFIWDSLQGIGNLGTLGKNNASAAEEVNDSGQVVGQSWTVTWVPPKKSNPYGNGSWNVSNQNAFLWISGRGMQDLGSSDASGINASGEVSGSVSGKNQSSSAALWNGTWHALGTLGGSGSSANGINIYGQIVGGAAVKSGAGHAFLWTPSTSGGTTGSMEDLGTFGGQFSYAYAVNSQGYVIGDADTAIGSAAYVWRPSGANGTIGTMIMLDPSGGGRAKGINGKNMVVGADNNFGDGQLRATLWEPSTNGSYAMRDLNSLIPNGTGWYLQSAEAINDSGQIVVQTNNGFNLLLTPSTTTTPQVHSVAATLISTNNGLSAFTAGPSISLAESIFSGPALASTLSASPSVSKAIVSAIPHGPGQSFQAAPKQTAANLDQVFIELGDLGLVDLGLGMA